MNFAWKLIMRLLQYLISVFELTVVLVYRIPDLNIDIFLQKLIVLLLKCKNYNLAILGKGVRK